MVICITGWDRLYEVDDKGRRWQPGRKKRVGQLEFVRLRVNGPDWSAGYRAFLKRAGIHTEIALGVFVKLLELSAHQESDRRGRILDRNGDPANAETIADMAGLRVKNVEKAIEILSDERVAWISIVTLPGTPGNSREIRDASRDQIRSDQINTDQSSGKKPPPPSTREKTDPLDAYPKLKAFYPDLLAFFKQEHPKTPDPTASQDLKNHETLSELVRLDDYTEVEVVSCLRWLFTAKDRGAVWWRENGIKAIRPMRGRKDGKPSKFEQVYEKWRKSKPVERRPEPSAIPPKPETLQELIHDALGPKATYTDPDTGEKHVVQIREELERFQKLRKRLMSEWLGGGGLESREKLGQLLKGSGTTPEILARFEHIRRVKCATGSESKNADAAQIARARQASTRDTGEPTRVGALVDAAMGGKGDK